MVRHFSLVSNINAGTGVLSFENQWKSSSHNSWKDNSDVNQLNIAQPIPDRYNNYLPQIAIFYAESSKR